MNVVVGESQELFSVGVGDVCIVDVGVQKFLTGEKQTRELANQHKGGPSCLIINPTKPVTKIIPLSFVLECVFFVHLLYDGGNGAG